MTACRLIAVSLVFLSGWFDAQGGGTATDSRSLIVISLKTRGGPASRCSNASLTSSYFTDARSVSAYYAENSYGLMRMSGTVVGPYEVSLEQDWNRMSVANAADAAATAAGVDLSLYAYKVYILPNEADPAPIQSAWGGSADRARSRLWIRDYWCTSKWIVAHELGHILGMNHASTPADEYGDFSSSMGGRVEPSSAPSTWNDMPHFNAPGKMAAGWLPASAVRMVTAPGKFQLASVETAPAATRIHALRIKGVNEGADDYYVSYRQAVGFSSVLTPQYVATTSITRWNGAPGSKTCLLATLADGQAFADASGLMVTQNSHDAQHAYVTITFGLSAVASARVNCP